MKIYVLDNGGQWTHREWRVLKYLGAEAKIIPNTTPFEDVQDGDGFVFSGGAPRIGTEAMKLGKTAEYLEKAKVPMLGICVGCQFIAIHFGGEAGPADTPEYGKMEVQVVKAEGILKNIPSTFLAWESHNDEIKILPANMDVLAHSDSCKYQAVSHTSRPIFGLQFHPEVEHTEYGMEMFKNFLDFCRE
ncbi:MAG: GMP synthase subunit A [Candidatus Thermoplasmatota archaeon]|nr:GMP synthase subunit A [Candidatus Thermoplasmatota archaeon]